MRRLALVLIAMLAAVVLAACSADPIDEVYMAPGDGSLPEELLSQTTTFQADDDLNVVVKLNAHKRTLEVRAIFTALSTNALYQTNTVEAEETTGEVVLGLDWETLGGGEYWPTGDWKVDIYLNNELEQTVNFTVEPVADTQPAQ
jgi:hypothetical protein